MRERGKKKISFRSESRDIATESEREVVVKKTTLAPLTQIQMVKKWFLDV